MKCREGGRSKSGRRRARAPWAQHRESCLEVEEGTIDSINRGKKFFLKTVIKIEILKVISVNVKTETLHYPLACYAHRLVLRHLSNGEAKRISWVRDEEAT